MSQQVIEYKFQPHADQQKFFAETALEVLFGGSRGPGKSAALVNYIFLYCMRYEGARCLLARRKLIMLLNSTWHTFRDWIPPQTYDYNAASHIIRFKNGSEVMLTGLDSNEDLDRFSSMELALVAIDEAQEVLESHYISLLSRLRQKLPGGVFPPYRMLCTANPAICYLRSRFILNPIPGKRVFIQSLTAANMGNLPPDYIGRLKEAYKDTPALYKQMVEGNWDISEEANSVIRYSKIETCVHTRHVKAFNNVKGVSCDSARYGDDYTVIYLWEGSKITDAVIRQNMDVPSVAAECVAQCKRIGGRWIAIDTCSGLGAGSYDVMKNLLEGTSDIQLISVNSSEAPSNAKYLNVRAEMYFTAGDMINDNLCTLPEDPILMADLAAQTYEYKLDKLKITAKEDIKKLLGRSPDRGDACVIGLYALTKLVQIIPAGGTYREVLGLGRNREPEPGKSYDQDMSQYDEGAGKDQFTFV